MQGANAFYSRVLRALLFGYFQSDIDSALNLPGQTVFTCLSHDIIAHETTHALVDSQRDFFSVCKLLDRKGKGIKTQSDRHLVVNAIFIPSGD
jgi:hypothetical protein